MLYLSYADTFTMKSLIALAIAVPFLTPSTAYAYAVETQSYTCRNYVQSERVVPGHYNEAGIWVSARIIQSNRAVPCDMPHGTHVSHGYHQQNNYYPQQYPQQQQPVIINNQPPAQSGGSCDQLARMGLGAGGGGAAGYYIGGGKKSKNTIRNATIGAVAGGLIGRILPC